MAVEISGVAPRSAAETRGISPGDLLLRINGQEITDILDYRFHITSRKVSLELLRPDKTPYQVSILKGEYDDPGLEFQSYLMDKQQSCRNKCVFCFIDQLPSGLRDTLYFKDDDSRMSFLFGNYITLTNLEDRDIERILAMRTSPINISVHTTDPALRVKMMKNPRAGEVLEYIPRLVKAGIKVNAQIVLCPDFNDGAKLEKSLADLSDLTPGLQSVSIVPAGLTRFREGLATLRPFTGEEAAAVIDMIDRFGRDMISLHGERIFCPSDEFYLLAGRKLPDYEYYGEFHQLENGVGMLTLLEHEFKSALNLEEPRPLDRTLTIATGAAAFPLLSRLARLAEDAFTGVKIEVIPIRNEFLGESITVAGLVAGCDLESQLRGRVSGELLIPSSMLRHEGDLFLDSLSLEQLAERLECVINPVKPDGFALLDAILGIESID